MHASDSSLELIDHSTDVYTSVLQPVGIQREIDVRRVLDHVLKHRDAIMLDKLKMMVMIEERKTVLRHLLGCLFERSHNAAAALGILHGIKRHGAKSNALAAESCVLLHQLVSIVENAIHGHVRQHHGQPCRLADTLDHIRIKCTARILDIGIPHLFELHGSLQKMLLTIQEIANGIQIKSRLHA